MKIIKHKTTTKIMRMKEMCARVLSRTANIDDASLYVCECLREKESMYMCADDDGARLAG